MYKDFFLKALLKNILLDFYNNLDEVGLNDQEKDLYQRICFWLGWEEGFITNENLHNLSSKTHSNKKKILKKLAEKKVITITRKHNPLANNLYLHRFITCNICPNLKFKGK